MRRLAEPAASELAICAFHKAQASRAVGAEDNLECGLSTRERANGGSAFPTHAKEDYKCSRDFTLSYYIRRNSKSAFCPDAIGCKLSSCLDVCITLLVVGRFKVGRFQLSWVPLRQFLSSSLPWHHSTLCFSRFCFCTKLL